MGAQYMVESQQLAAAVEAAPGVAETLVAGDVKLRLLKGDAPWSIEPEAFENESVGDDLAAAPKLVAGRKASMPITLEVKSSGVLGTAPALGRYLRGLGLQEEIVRTITVGAPSPGAFAAGASYTAAGGTKTGTIEAARSGAGTLRYVAATGGALEAADVVSDGTNSATASGTGGYYAVKYRPISRPHETLTIQKAERNDLGTAGLDKLFRLRGAMGTGSLVFAALNRIRLEADYQGVLEAYEAGSFFAGVAYESGTPPTFLNASVQLDGTSRQVASIKFNFGSELMMEPDPTTVGGTDGYDYARIARRAPTIEIDPYAISDVDDIAAIYAGTTKPFALSLGTTPQIVELVAPYCQLSALAPGARNGRRTHGITLDVTRHETLLDQDYAIYFR